MRLYFLRHAHAMARADWNGEEPARPLTDKGRQQAEGAAAGLASLRPGFAAIISSPFARAYETAVIVGRVAGLPVESSDDLTPGFDLPRLDHTLSLRPEVDGALLVGHEPDLSQMIDALVSRAGEPHTHVTMAKASCCLVVTPDDLPGGASAAELIGRCSLAWERTWKELESLGHEGASAG
ncbi:MAG: SixA phosphatase family protein [Ktedonobacterales bacterium]|jgi:phosphohistidine phosphatase SixA